MSKQTYSGYPGVHPNPHNQDSPKDGEVITVISKDGANALIRDSSGSIRVVPNEWVKPA